MASKSRRKKARVGPSFDQLSADMQRHVKLLGFASVATYLEWCRRHHFPHHVRKTTFERRREARHARRVAVERRAREGRRTRNPKAATRRLLRGECEAVDNGFAPLHAALQTPTDDGRRTLLRALLRRLLRVAPKLLEPDDDTFAVLVRMLDHWRDRCRDPENWRPTTHNRTRMLESLLRHCFVEFEPPRLLQACWHEGDDHAARHRSWFVGLARGRSVRSLDLPLACTRRMAHWFQQAPDDLDPDAALRYGQVRGLGGSEELARAVCASRLGRTFEHDDFWRTVVAFLAQHRFERRYEVIAIVDYLYDQRFVGAACVDANGQRRRLPPPQPNLTMAGRDPDALRRQSDAWHRRFGFVVDGSQGGRSWERSELGGYREERQGATGRETWVVVELCSAPELRHEGQTMGHCVYTYTGDCAEGQSRIFSVRALRGGKVEHVATVEWWRGRIFQVRGRRNARAPDDAERVIRSWAAHVDVPIRSSAW
jgi:hypothetical protein